jgi:hypothetical protein
MDGPKRARALPRTLPVPRDGYKDKSGKINRIRMDYLNSMSLFYSTLIMVYKSIARDDPEAVSMSCLVELMALKAAFDNIITLTR